MIARVELGLSDEEWFDLDYRQLRLLHDRWLTLRWQDQWQRGMAIAASYRNGMRTYDPMPGPDDFLFTIVPGQKRQASQSMDVQKTPEDIMSIFKAAARQHAAT